METLFADAVGLCKRIVSADAVSSTIGNAQKQEAALSQRIAVAQQQGNAYYNQGEKIYQTASKYVSGLTVSTVHSEFSSLIEKTQREEDLLTTLLPSENSLIRLIAYRLIQSSGPLMKWAYCFVRKRYF